MLGVLPFATHDTIDNRCERYLLCSPIMKNHEKNLGPYKGEYGRIRPYQMGPAICAIR